MKKLILLAGAMLALVGCNQGGTEDEYGTSSGSTSNYNRSTPRSENRDATPAPATTTNNQNITP
jgi:hypothetical protein